MSKATNSIGLLLLLLGLCGYGEQTCAQQVTAFPNFDGRTPVEEGGSPPPEQAFGVTASASGENKIIIQFTPYPGFYIYRHRISFDIAKPDGVSIANIELPAGELKNDPTFGDTEVFMKPFAATVTLQRESGSSKNIKLQTTLTGSNKLGERYPPFSKTVNVVFTTQP